MTIFPRDATLAMIQAARATHFIQGCTCGCSVSEQYSDIWAAMYDACVKEQVLAAQVPIHMDDYGNAIPEAA